VTVIHRKGEQQRYFDGPVEISEAEYTLLMTPWRLRPDVTPEHLAALSLDAIHQQRYEDMKRRPR
jgi:hypothetical protein